MKLKPLALGLAVGITWGVVILMATRWVMILGGKGVTLAKLSMYYFGYSVTFIGSLIGLFWGFVDGLVGGAIVAFYVIDFVATAIHTHWLSRR